MADDRRRRELARRGAVRSALKATRKALSEITPSQRVGAGTIPRPTLKQTQEWQALATHPSITFATTKEGQLVSRDIRGTARHEIAHHLGAGHPAFRAVTGGLGGLSRREVPQVVRMQKEPAERRVQRAIRRRSQLGAATTRRPEPGYQTPQLRKAAKTGTPTQRRQARERMRRLGRRLRGRIDF